MRSPALQQLCAPVLDRLDRLPGPQGDALGLAFGLRAGDAPDRFLVGLAVLSLLAEMSEERPLVCVVDDAQWLDRASAQALVFVARRLLAESIALVLVTRDPVEELRGFQELVVEGLRDGDARALLSSAVGVPLDERVQERIVAETRGNPLASLELPRGLTPAQLAGGFGLPGAMALSRRIEESFRRRLATLPADTRRFLVVAAADPVGDPALVWRAAKRLGVGPEAANAAEADGLLSIGGTVQFRHPLVRSATYQAASAEQRRRAHGALADATDPASDADRRAWHRAQAAPGPTRTSPPSLNARPAERRAVAASRPRRHFSSGRPSSRLTRRAERGELSPRRGPCTRPAPSTRPSAFLPPRRRGLWSSSSAPASTRCARRSRSLPGAAATPRRCSSRQPSGLKRWMSGWRAIPIWTRLPPECSPAEW